MTRLDLKAIGFGFATFIACTLLMTLAATVVGSAPVPAIGESRWKLIKIVGYLAPVVAGYVGARQASVRRILHGTIGGAIGAVLLLAPALFVPGYPMWGIPFILAWYAALASLGAIFGNHRANRVGPQQFIQAEAASRPGLIQALGACPNNRDIHMAKTITISLPVTDLDTSKVFYSAIGFEPSPNFSGPTAAMMVWSESISVMLLTHERWRTFTTRPIPPSTSSEVALNISCESREDVNAMAESAGRNGGTTDINPVEDHGSMYGRDFCDPDGHVWGAMWMDPAARPDASNTSGS